VVIGGRLLTFLLLTEYWIKDFQLVQLGMWWQTDWLRTRGSQFWWSKLAGRMLLSIFTCICLNYDRQKSGSPGFHYTWPWYSAFRWYRAYLELYDRPSEVSW
jgi:hypothetical protein